MGQVMKIGEYKRWVRGKQFANFLDIVEPRLFLNGERWLQYTRGELSEEVTEAAIAGYERIMSLWAGKKIPLDKLLKELLTYKTADPIALWLLPSSILLEMVTSGGSDFDGRLEELWEAVEQHFPESVEQLEERQAARGEAEAEK